MDTRNQGDGKDASVNTTDARYQRVRNWPPGPLHGAFWLAVRGILVLPVFRAAILPSAPDGGWPLWVLVALYAAGMFLAYLCILVAVAVIDTVLNVVTGGVDALLQQQTENAEASDYYLRESKDVLREMREDVDVRSHSIPAVACSVAFLALGFLDVAVPTLVTATVFVFLTQRIAGS